LCVDKGHGFVEEQAMHFHAAVYIVCEKEEEEEETV